MPKLSKHKNKQNIHKCMARKNLKGDINVQCPHPSKYGEYCGYHKHKRIRIDEPIPSKKQPSKQNNEYDNKINKLPYKFVGIPKGKNQEMTAIKTINYNDFIYLITIDDYRRGSIHRAKVKDLRYSLSHYKLSSQGLKKDLTQRIIDYFKRLLYYQDHLDNIVWIQRRFRQKLKDKVVALRGMGYFERHICVNDYDFYTCNNKEDIEADYFISYQDDAGLNYCFDVRSLDKLYRKNTNSNPINPFSMKPIPPEVLVRNYEIIEQLKADRIYQDIYEPPMTPKQLHINNIVTLFRQIDELDNHTNVDWFFNLNVHELHLFYHHLLEIWYHRASLTNQVRNRIVPGPALFKMTSKDFAKYKSKTKCQTMLVDIMRRLITSAVARSDRVLGSLYIITGLCEVSPACAQAHPWLLNN